MYGRLADVCFDHCPRDPALGHRVRVRETAAVIRGHGCSGESGWVRRSASALCLEIVNWNMQTHDGGSVVVGVCGESGGVWGGCGEAVGTWGIGECMGSLWGYGMYGESG